MSAKFEAFKAALEKLCLEHQIDLCPSGYDGLEAWNLQDGDAPTYIDSLVDQTHLT